MAGQQRRTAKRKAEIILQILRQTTTVIDVARQNDLTPSEVQEWVDTFLKGGEQGLKARVSGAQEQTEREIKELKAAIGELFVENAILKNKGLVGDLGRDKILTLHGELIEDGIQASIRQKCTVRVFHRSSVYYSSRSRHKATPSTDPWLIEEIPKIIEENPEYGTRRIAAVLRRKHRRVFNRKKGP
jgi:transposase-like protein